MRLDNMYYHGIRENIRRVLNVLGDERIDKGLTAFDTGASSWAQCFFARALAPAALHTEFDVARELAMTTSDGRWNLVPIRTIYRTFDGRSNQITKAQLKKFIEDVRWEKHTSSVNKFLASLDFSNLDEPITLCAVDG